LAKGSFERILALLRPTISRPRIAIKTTIPTIMPIIFPKPITTVEGSSPGLVVTVLKGEEIVVAGLVTVLEDVGGRITVAESVVEGLVVTVAEAVGGLVLSLNVVGG